MPTGLQVKNDDGEINIDEEYRNFSLKTQGTATIGTTNIGGSVALYNAQIQVTNCTSPILALRATTSVSVVGTQVSGSTYTFDVYSNTSNHTFNYYVFDVPTAPADTFGLQVFNSSGDLVFHSSNKHMKIAYVYNANDGGSSGNTLASGKTYAVVQGAVGWRNKNFLRLGTWRYIAIAAGHKFTGTTLYLNWPTIGIAAPANRELLVDEVNPSADSFAYEYTPQTPKFLVLDVTNY